MFLRVVFNLNSFTVFTLRWGIVKCGEDFDRCLALKNLVQGDVFIFNSNQFCSMIELSHMILSNDGLVALHYKSYEIFCVHPKSLIISVVELPTTDIIEPFFATYSYLYLSFVASNLAIVGLV